MKHTPITPNDIRNLEQENDIELMQRIVRACNAHDDLVKQLKSAAQMLNYLAPEKFDDDDHETNWNRMLEDMDHAIAKAEGRQ